MPQRAAIKSIPHRLRMLKQKQTREPEWGEDYGRVGTEALKGVLEPSTATRVDSHLEEMADRGCPDRRNGNYWRVVDDGVGGDRAQSAVLVHVQGRWERCGRMRRGRPVSTR